MYKYNYESCVNFIKDILTEDEFASANLDKEIVYRTVDNMLNSIQETERVAICKNYSLGTKYQLAKLSLGKIKNIVPMIIKRFQKSLRNILNDISPKSPSNLTSQLHQ